MTKTLLVLIVLLFVSMPAFSQSIDTAWVRRYNGPSDSLDWAHAIAVDGSNNVYVTGLSRGSGTSSDYATIKYYPNGDTAWVRRYNGPGDQNDEADAIAVDGSNNVYVTGYSWGSGTFYDVATIKYYPNGDIAWVRRYNGPDNGYDVAQAIAVDGSNNVYVIGYSWGSGTRDDYTTIKYYPNGDTAWVRRYNGPGNYDDYPSAIAVDASNNVYVTGETRSSGTSSDYATIKYYPNGDTAWVRSYNGTGDTTDVANSIALDSYGNVYVSGYSYGSTTSFDYVTVKYDSSGTELWVKRYDGPVNGWDEARALATDGSGNVCVTGVSVGSGYNEDYLTIKYYPNGDTAWVRRHNGPGNYADQAYALAVDGSGNVYVTGFSGVGLSYDYATIKYYPNGHIAWVRTYNGQGNGTDYAQDMAVDVSGNVYVTGGSYGVGTDYDYATIKYIYRYIFDTLLVVAHSPVNLIVEDPKGDSIGIGFNTIPGATYDITNDSVTIPNRLVGNYLIRVVPEGTGHYDLGIRIDGGDWQYIAKQATCPPPGTDTTFTYNAPWYMRGDENGDWKINLSDVIYLAKYTFGVPGYVPDPLESGDLNCDGKYDLVDVIKLARYLLYGEPFPC